MSEDNRLTSAEETFVLAEQVLDLPVINQMIWRFDTPLDADRLKKVVDRLRSGPLTRRLHRAGAPFARDTWFAAPPSAPVLRIDDTIDPARLIEWLDHDIDREFHTDSGAPWTVSAVPLDDGGHVVAFTAPHTLSDGTGINAAFEAAVTGRDIGRLPDDNAVVPSRLHDVRDGARQLVAAGRGLAGAVRLTARNRKGRGAVDRRTPPPQPRRPAVIPVADAEDSAYALAAFSAEDWHHAANLRGGSANSLLVAIGVGLLEAAGRIDDVPEIPVSMPVTVRTSGDRRAIATIGATLAVGTDRSRYDDLRPIRSAARDALTRATDPDRDSDDLLRLITPIVRLLPRKVLRSLALRQPAAVLTCSNLGELPQDVATLGASTPGQVAVRMAVQHATVEQLRAARGGLTVWLSFSAGTAMLSVLSMDPDLWPNRAAVQRAITEEAAKWSLAPTFW
ncbi:MAG TPA: hypothetical protein VG502_07485 [Flexivirga sp.]|uniref:hypothetical protein n=1 Tax=Flexivirga sp. TaxID=1962927 RepID=UPI002C0DD70E|nr:hypothetical protein [Flexivirga sp.]HWC22126.1 hypothetical protein [Flexivirga sp.]